MGVKLYYDLTTSNYLLKDDQPFLTGILHSFSHILVPLVGKIAPKPILGLIMRSFDMYIKITRVFSKSGKAGPLFKSLAQSKSQINVALKCICIQERRLYPSRHLPISESEEAYGVDDRHELCIQQIWIINEEVYALEGSRSPSGWPGTKCSRPLGSDHI